MGKKRSVATQINVGRTWLVSICVVLGTIIGILAYARGCQQQNQQGTLNMSVEMARYDRFLNRAAGSISDSIRAGQSRASARGFGRGSVAAHEIRRGLEPLKDSIGDRWFELESMIKQSLTSMGLSDTSSQPYKHFMRLESLTDSILTVIDSVISSRK